MDEPQFLAELGERLRKARIAAGLMQRELGERAGISRPSVANIEAGRQEIAATMLAKLAKGCNVSVGYLIGESDMDVMDRLFDAESALADLVAVEQAFDRAASWGRARETLARIPAAAYRVD